MNYKKIVFIILISAFNLFAQNNIKIISWNVLNLGFYTKNKKIDFIISNIKDADIVVLQEIKSNSYGTADFKRLFLKLNQSSQNWDYALSGSTSGPGQEQYAYIWKKDKIKLREKAWLDPTSEKEIDREPYLARFEFKNKNFTLANFHAVPHKKGPWEEIKLLPKTHERYLSDNIIFCGDFNLTHKNRAYTALYENGYEASLKNQKTTIKAEEKNGMRLANDLDNFYYEKHFFTVSSSGAIDFTANFSSLKEAREMSDHLPIYLVLSF